MDDVYVLYSTLLNDKGITLDKDQRDKFESYFHALVSWNERMNLTGITDKEQVYIKHFYDSLSLAFHVPMVNIKTIADIGSGAGFPSIPLKIVFPHLKITIVDSLNKRVQFLNHIKDLLGLRDVSCVHGRAEDVGRKPMFRDQFDLVTARAVARLHVLNEFCLPFVVKGGLFVAMKGSDPSEEVKEASYSAKELQAELQHVYSFTLPVAHAHRHLIVYRKLQGTPAKYPRKAGIPLTNPLVGK